MRYKVAYHRASLRPAAHFSSARSLAFGAHLAPGAAHTFVLPSGCTGKALSTLVIGCYEW